MNLFPAQGDILYCSGCNNASNVLFRSVFKTCCPDNNYVLCAHKNATTLELDASVTTVASVEFCFDCKKQLTEPKIKSYV